MYGDSILELKSGKTSRFRRSSVDSSALGGTIPHPGEEVCETEACGAAAGVSSVFLPPIAHANSNHDGLYNVDSTVFRCV